MAIELTEQEVIRRQKLEEFNKLGINSYPADLYEVNVTSKEILEHFPQDNSLYQNVGGTVGEVAEGVQDMQITYLLTGATGYVNGSAVTDWAQVRAVRFDLTLASQDRVGSDGNPITRQLIHVVTIRSRNV